MIDAVSLLCFSSCAQLRNMSWKHNAIFTAVKDFLLDMTMEMEENMEEHDMIIVAAVSIIISLVISCAICVGSMLMGGGLRGKRDAKREGLSKGKSINISFIEPSTRGIAPFQAGAPERTTTRVEDRAEGNRYQRELTKRSRMKARGVHSTRQGQGVFEDGNQIKLLPSVEYFIANGQTFKICWTDGRGIREGEVVDG